MAAVENPRLAEPAEYHVFLMNRIQPSAREYRVAGIGTIAFHIVLIATLLLLPTRQPQRDEPIRPVRRITPLVDPPLTQKERNKAPLIE